MFDHKNYDHKLISLLCCKLLLQMIHFQILLVMSKKNKEDIYDK